MNVEELFESEYQISQILSESVAIAKIRKEAKKLAGKPISMTVRQDPNKKDRYKIFINRSGKVLTADMANGKFVETGKITPEEAATKIGRLDIRGWHTVDTRSWVQKYQIPIIMGAVGTVTAIGLSSGGLVPLSAVLMPIISTFFGIFANLLGEQIRNPLNIPD